MLIVNVYVSVKSECIQEFREETLRNAMESVKEPGIARFDVLQQEDDPTQFLLVEMYRTPEAPAAHKETAHYKRWKASVEQMMAVARRSTRYTNLHPSDDKLG